MSESSNITVPETLKNPAENCIFCKIIETNDPNVILEPRSNEFAIIKDVKPVATHHFLVLSHKHIKSAKSLQPCEQDRNLLERMIAAAKQVLSNNGCDSKDTRMGFHWPPFYTIGHMHLHVISPVSSMSFLDRYATFNPSISYVFVDVAYVQKRISCEGNKKIEDQSIVE